METKHILQMKQEDHKWDRVVDLPEGWGCSCVMFFSLTIFQGKNHLRIVHLNLCINRPTVIIYYCIEKKNKNTNKQKTENYMKKATNLLISVGYNSELWLETK